MSLTTYSSSDAFDVPDGFLPWEEGRPTCAATCWRRSAASRVFLRCCPPSLGCALDSRSDSFRAICIALSSSSVRNMLVSTPLAPREPALRACPPVPPAGWSASSLTAREALPPTRKRPREEKSGIAACLDPNTAGWTCPVRAGPSRAGPARAGPAWASPAAFCFALYASIFCCSISLIAAVCLAYLCSGVSVASFACS